MGTTYTVRMKASVWKRQTCCACASVFRYRLEREVRATEFEEALGWTARNRLERALRNGVDPHPCPVCGLLQPDMMGRVRAHAHLSAAGVGLLVGGLVIGLLAMSTIPAPFVRLMAAAGALVTLVLHARTSFGNPNADIDSNLETAEAEQRRGVLVLEHEDSREAAVPTLAPHVTGLVIFVVALAVLGADGVTVLAGSAASGSVWGLAAGFALLLIAGIASAALERARFQPGELVADDDGLRKKGFDGGYRPRFDGKDRERLAALADRRRVARASGTPATRRRGPTAVWRRYHTT